MSAYIRRTTHCSHCLTSCVTMVEAVPGKLCPEACSSCGSRDIVCFPPRDLAEGMTIRIVEEMGLGGDSEARDYARRLWQTTVMIAQIIREELKRDQEREESLRGKL